jgi:hypothetical protein
MRMENEQYREKIKELENWIILLLNNFYDGNQDSMQNIEHGLKRIDELRGEKFALKKAVLIERKRYMDLQDQYLELKRSMKVREEEIVQNYETGSLLIQKQALEQTLRALSEEVECLSQKNEKLLGQLLQREYF